MPRIPRVSAATAVVRKANEHLVQLDPPEEEDQAEDRHRQQEQQQHEGHRSEQLSPEDRERGNAGHE